MPLLRARTTHPSSPLPPQTVPRAPRPAIPGAPDVYRVKLPSRYSSNFRPDEVARNCNDVFGRLTYRLGNLFIRVARRPPPPPPTWEMYGIVGNTPRAKRKLPPSAAPAGEIRIASGNGSCRVSHRRRDKNTSSPTDAAITGAGCRRCDPVDTRDEARLFSTNVACAPLVNNSAD